MGNTIEVTKALVRAYDAGDTDAYVDLLASDAVLHPNGGPAVRGRDAIHDIVSMQRNWAPDQTIDRTHWVEDGDWVAFRWLMRATHSVDSPALPATGRRFELLGASHVHVVNGKVAELFGLWDKAGFLRQIGQLPEAQPTAPPVDRSEGDR